MSKKIFKNLNALLTEQNAKFRVLEHEAAGTSQSVAKVRGTHLGQGAKALVCLVKGITLAQDGGESFLKIGEESVKLASNAPEILKLPADRPVPRNGRIYVLAVFPADHKASLANLAAALGGTKASLTSEEECAALTDCVVGSIPPFSFHDRLLLVCDEKLFGRFSEIAFNAGLLDRSIVLDVSDYKRVANPLVINFAEQAADPA